MHHSGVFSSQELGNYFASYVGMEGGNPGASVWICDGSPHPWFEPLAAPLLPRMAPPAWDAVFREKHRDDMARWLNHQRIARIMAAARAEALGLRLGDHDWKEYYAHHLYTPHGAEFKLNLFPLPMQLDGLTPWSKVFRGQAEMVPKDRYLALCRNGGRFRFLQELCAHWRPKVVVCLGYRHCDDFVRAFGLGEVQCEDLLFQPADQVRRLQVFARGGTTWIVCPALAGSAGLTSDVQLNALGKLLGASLEPSDFGQYPMRAAAGDGVSGRASSERGWRQSHRVHAIQQPGPGHASCDAAT